MPFDVSIIIGSGSLSKLRNPNTMFYKTNQYIIFNIKFQLIYSLLSDYYQIIIIVTRLFFRYNQVRLIGIVPIYLIAD